MELVRQLPDYYVKDPNSNNAKILQVAQDALDNVGRDLELTEAAAAIDLAFGQTLDFFGEMYGVPRGVWDDDIYRVKIKQKIGINACDGTMNSVLAATMIIFGATPEEIHLVDDKQHPATVFVEKMPLQVINRLGMTAAEAAQVIESLLAAGVALWVETFGGTFAFSAEYEAEDITAPSGFSDEYRQGNIGKPTPPGGYLGDTFDR